jgi:excisionase family DNA binding protein
LSGCEPGWEGTGGCVRENPPMAEPQHYQSLELSTPGITVTLSAEAVLAIAGAVQARLQPMAAPVESPFLTVREAASYIRAKPQRIYDLLSSGRVPKHKDGARVLILRADLDAHLELR